MCSSSSRKEENAEMALHNSLAENLLALTSVQYNGDCRRIYESLFGQSADLSKQYLHSVKCQEAANLYLNPRSS